jgi:hypothetical protein
VAHAVVAAERFESRVKLQQHSHCTYLVSKMVVATFGSGTLVSYGGANIPRASGICLFSKRFCVFRPRVTESEVVYVIAPSNL